MGLDAHSLLSLSIISVMFKAFTLSLLSNTSSPASFLSQRHSGLDCPVLALASSFSHQQGKASGKHRQHTRHLCCFKPQSSRPCCREFITRSTCPCESWPPTAQVSKVMPCCLCSLSWRSRKSNSAPPMPAIVGLCWSMKKYLGKPTSQTNLVIPHIIPPASVLSITWRLTSLLVGQTVHIMWTSVSNEFLPLVVLSYPGTKVR